LDDDEYGELLTHIRSRIRELGRADLDERVMESRRLDDQRSAAGDVEAYLQALRNELVLGGEERASETMRLFQEVQTESGRPPTGIVVDVQPDDRASLGMDRVDLVGSPELDSLVEELDAILDALAEDRRSQ
jgi:hypothetical protein